MKNLLEKWQLFWKSRQPGERRALSLMIIIVTLALLAQLLWSGIHATERLRKKLPELQAQAIKIQADANEWQELSNAADSPNKLPQQRLHEEIKNSISRFGNQLNITWQGSSLLKIDGQVSHNDWILWLAQLHKDYQLIVKDATISPASSGLVNVEATLTRSHDPSSDSP